MYVPLGVYFMLLCHGPWEQKEYFLSFEENISQGGATFSLHFQRSARLSGEKSAQKPTLQSHQKDSSHKKVNFVQ